MEMSGNQRMLLEVVRLAGRMEERASGALSKVKGISLGEYRILRALHDMADAEPTRVALADEVGLTPSGVTRALRPLEKMGLVATERDGRDARKALAVLTPAGVELLGDASALLDDHLETLRVTAQEESALMEVLRTLAGEVRPSP